MLSDTHALSYARAFMYWCYERDEMNPRFATLITWLEYNHPRDGNKFMDDVHDNADKIWDNFWPTRSN